jgi:hypothetical protein
MKRLLACLLLAGCASVPSFTDALGVGYLAVDSLALLAFELCANEVPGGTCRENAPISTEQKDAAREALERALGMLDDARFLYAAGEVADAADRLQQARAVLRGVETLLEAAR